MLTRLDADRDLGACGAARHSLALVMKLFKAAPAERPAVPSPRPGVQAPASTWPGSSSWRRRPSGLPSDPTALVAQAASCARAVPIATPISGPQVRSVSFCSLLRGSGYETCVETRPSCRRNYGRHHRDHGPMLPSPCSRNDCMLRPRSTKINAGITTERGATLSPSRRTT